MSKKTTDAVLRNFKLLLKAASRVGSSFTPEDRAQIQKAITEREAELRKKRITKK